VTRRIDSDALGTLGKSLGLSGNGSQMTELSDGIVDQVIDVNPSVRRGRTLAEKQGIFYCVIRNVHTDAETIVTPIDPYRVGVDDVVAPYPDRISTRFDLWLLGAMVRRLSGGGTIQANLAIDYDQNQGWGVDDSGTAIVSTEAFNVAFWNSLATNSDVFALLSGALQPYIKLGIRLPRADNTSLIFTSASSLTSTYQCQMIIGMFPAALGQDGLV